MNERPTSETPSSARNRRPLIFAAIAVVIVFDVWFLIWWLPARKSRAPIPVPIAQAAPSAAPAPSSPPVAGPVAVTDFADPETRRWQTAPRGTQVCDGVTFICDGAIRTSGLRAARDLKSYPGAVLDVPVHARGNRIHLLQSSENSGGAIAGAPYGRMVLHYTNGATRRLDLLFRAHGRDWMHNPRNPDQPLIDENTTVGWLETHPRSGFDIRFHHATFTNPLPNVEITSADFISPLYSANLLLFGLTVDDNARPLTTPWQPGETNLDIPPADKITVTLQNAAGHPVIGGLAWTAQTTSGRIDFPSMPTDAQGRVALEFQHGALQQILYTATTPDGKIISSTLQADEAGRFAPNVAVTMQ